MSIATTLEPRPHQLTDTLRMKIARELAQKLFDEDLINGEESIIPCANDISNNALISMDGYELARGLEERCGWIPTLEIAQILDNYGDVARNAIDDLQKDWVIRNNIQPPYSVGTRVVVKRGWDDRCGFIVEIFEHGPAKYIVRLDGQSATTGAIVNFEDVTTELTSQLT